MNDYLYRWEAVAIRDVYMDGKNLSGRGSPFCISKVLLKSVCRCSQFLLDRLGRYLNLFESTVGPSYHEFASQ